MPLDYRCMWLMLPSVPIRALVSVRDGVEKGHQ
jgi:hypothetical protein